MPQMKGPACGGQITDLTRQCPSCGEPQRLPTPHPAAEPNHAPTPERAAETAHHADSRDAADPSPTPRLRRSEKAFFGCLSVIVLIGLLGIPFALLKNIAAERDLRPRLPGTWTTSITLGPDVHHESLAREFQNSARYKSPIGFAAVMIITANQNAPAPDPDRATARITDTFTIHPDGGYTSTFRIAVQRADLQQDLIYNVVETGTWDLRGSYMICTVSAYTVTSTTAMNENVKRMQDALNTVHSKGCWILALDDRELQIAAHDGGQAELVYRRQP